ncbi:MAG: hypothetical protein R2726_01765 [Acidimicrobiales bacterium]
MRSTTTAGPARPTPSPGATPWRSSWPPTWITLEHLARFASVDQAMAVLRDGEPEHFETRFAVVEGGAVALYAGDVAYDDLDADPARAGGRHRLWMLGTGWRYERDDWA